MQVNRLWIRAAVHVEEIEHQEDAQKNEACHGDNGIHWLVMQQVHEDQRYDRRLDGGDRKRDHDIARAKINVGCTYRYGCKDKQRSQRDQVFSGFCLRIDCVFGMRAHVIK